MNANPLFKPLRLGQHSFPGIWRFMMPADLMKLRFPVEREANCMNCPKSCYEGWRPDYRCCTYHPRISNFLLGLASQTPEGEQAVRALLQRGMVLPEGMHSAPQQWVDFIDDEHHDRFGKSRKVLCPMLDPASGFCRIHVFRNSVCSTYFCTKDQGHAGEVFWSQIQTLGTQLEMRLGQWALREIGFDLDASLQALDAWAPRLAQASTGDGWHPEALKDIWGKAWGQEMEILRASADLIMQHQDRLWTIAQKLSIREVHDFDKALMLFVPEEQRAILDDDEESWEEIVNLNDLWDDCLSAHEALWADPEGLFLLNSQVSFVPNHRQTSEDRYHQDKDFFLEYRFNNPERSLYFRLGISADQKRLLESFQCPRALADADPADQDFLRDMCHRKVLRSCS
jgi:Fe-S-cluster containining protein